MKKLLLVFLLAGCSNIVGPNGPLPKVLLEIEFQNYAFQPAFYGYYLNGLGDVYSYNRNGQHWEFQDSVNVTREDQDNKYVPIKNLLHTRPKSEVDSVQTMINAVVPSQMSPKKSQCADAGELTYYAYVYDVDSGKYTNRIILWQQGDIAQQNTSPAAQQLINYIRSLNLVTEMQGCRP